MRFFYFTLSVLTLPFSYKSSPSWDELLSAHLLLQDPVVIEKGGEWYSKIGAPKHPGTILIGVSGLIYGQLGCQEN